MLTGLSEKGKKALDHLHDEFSKLQAGRARPELVESISVMAYGSPGPLKNVATVSVMDPQTLSISPFDKSLLGDISRGINSANVGLNPQDKGESILINIPPLTEDRRRDIVKMAKNLAEEAKVSIRNIRSEYHKNISRAKDDKEITEDEAKMYDTDLQKEVDTCNKQIDTYFQAKEKDLMTV